MSPASDRDDDLQPVAVEHLRRAVLASRHDLAVERNGEIVPRAAHASTWLADGDRLEIVVAVAELSP